MMFKYELVRLSDSVVTHTKFIDQDIPAGDAWAELPQGWNLGPSNYRIDKTDVTAQFDQKDSDRAEVDNFRSQLQAGLTAIQDATTVDDLKPVLRGILRYIRAKER